MKSYQESFDAGVQYGKQYRRTNKTWTAATNVARRGADAQSGMDYTGFFNGVISGLKPFSASDFEKTFNENAQRARYKAAALLGRMRLQVETQDEAHYLKTLKQWEDMGAILQTGAQYATV